MLLGEGRLRLAMARWWRAPEIGNVLPSWKMAPATGALLKLEQGGSFWYADQPLAVPWPNAPLPARSVLQCIPFDVHAFDDARFADAGIDCPPHIAHSAHKRKAHYFYGRLCAHEALKQLGCAGAVGCGATRVPVWPEGVVGSITHSHALAAAVVAPASLCRGVGIDVEEVVTPEVWDALRHSVVSPAEYDLLQVLAGRTDLGTLLTLVFSAKESFFKASFSAVGRYFDFDALVLRDIDFERSELIFVLSVSLCAEWLLGQEVRITYQQSLFGCVATLCVW